MSAVFVVGRLVARPKLSPSSCLGLSFSPFRNPVRPLGTITRSFAWRSRGQSGHGSWHGQKHGARTLLAASNGALGTAVFVELSQKDNQDTDETGERRMLSVSREEIKKKVDDDDTGFSRLRHQVVLFLDLYIWEPICTGLRFLQLAAIFVPVILTVPAIWVGPRQPDRDNERSGTLWWYGFLVKAMEWAGPAFIKVDRHAVQIVPTRGPELIWLHM
jgi:aarF domain-containing kinase